MGYLLTLPGIKGKSFKKQLNNCIMKNVIKIGFFAVALSLFAVACGGGAKTESADSTATAPALDSAAQHAAAPADTLAKVDTSAAPAAADTAAHH